MELPEPDPPEVEPPEVDVEPAGTFGDAAGAAGVAGLSAVEDSLAPSDVVEVDSVPAGAAVSPIRDADPPPDLLSVL